jgi:hypothetical protein
MKNNNLQIITIFETYKLMKFNFLINQGYNKIVGIKVL